MGMWNKLDAASEEQKGSRAAVRGALKQQDMGSARNDEGPPPPLAQIHADLGRHLPQKSGPDVMDPASAQRFTEGSGTGEDYEKYKAEMAGRKGGE